MSPRRALVVVRDGPATERGWLGLRAALALGLGGCDVAVWLAGPGAAWALPLDARVWLGGDPGADLAGLIEDTEAEVYADAAEVERAGAVDRLRPGVRPVVAGILADLLRASDLVLAP